MCIFVKGCVELSSYTLCDHHCILITVGDHFIGDQSIGDQSIGDQYDYMTVPLYHCITV